MELKSTTEIKSLPEVLNSICELATERMSELTG